MLNSYITAATTTQVYTGQAKKIIIMINNPGTSNTITVIDDIQGTTANIAVIPSAGLVQGQKYEYWGFQTGVRIVTTATCDITVSCDLSRPGAA